MGLEAIILTILGIPRGWLTSLTYEKIKAFSEKKRKKEKKGQAKNN